MSDKVTDANYALEWFLEAESVTIRSALKFCIDIVPVWILWRLIWYLISHIYENVQGCGKFRYIFRQPDL